jgi:5-methylcytosine-specific restriction endonuclease McrA
MPHKLDPLVKRRHSFSGPRSNTDRVAQEIKQFEQLAGSLMPGSPSTIATRAAKLDSVIEYLNRALRSQRELERKEELRSEIDRLRRTATAPRTSIERIFGRKMSEEDAATLRSLEDSYKPSPFDIAITTEPSSVLSAQLDTLLRYRSLLNRSHNAAFERERTRAASGRARQEREAEREAKLEQKRAEAESARQRREAERIAKVNEETDALRAMAAAYQGRGREEADRVKRYLGKQFSISENCPYCSRTLGSDFHADHIYPLSLGGHSTLANMVVVCASCNLAKGNKTLRAFARAAGIDFQALEKRLLMLNKVF